MSENALDALAMQYLEVLAERDRLAEINKVLVEALEKAEQINRYQAMTGLPINVREPDGSVSQHRPKSIAGNIQDILIEALAKAKEMGNV